MISGRLADLGGWAECTICFLLTLLLRGRGLLLQGRGCFLLSLMLLSSPVEPAVAQCPWGRDPQLIELQSSCLCAENLNQQLSIQCNMVNFTQLIAALHGYARDHAIDLVYANNSVIPVLQDNVFKGLKISNIQLSNAKIEKISPGAFRGLEDTLQGINLAKNRLTEAPVDTLRSLRLVNTLDLSHNSIQYIPNNAFVTLRLKTLKLSNNNLTLAKDAFKGLEQSLNNLNLKDCHLKGIPEAVQSMAGLAFLDLASNNIRSIPGGALAGLSSLTALNLERNVIQRLDPDIFRGVNDTLSSVSLLNNLLTNYPKEAITSLKELRVLDLGFNLLRTLPIDAFTGINSLTLLALDGNPMATVPEDAFHHLNSSLRGLSLGGRFLTCDCRLRWVAQWIQDLDLQVTSRERSPQFCGNPLSLRERSFYQLNPNDLVCAAATKPPKPPVTRKPVQRFPPSQATRKTIQRFPSPTTPVPLVPNEVIISSHSPNPIKKPVRNMPTRRPTYQRPSPTSFPETVVRIGPSSPAQSRPQVPTFPPRKNAPSPGDVITAIGIEVGPSQQTKLVGPPRKNLFPGRSPSVSGSPPHASPQPNVVSKGRGNFIHNNRLPVAATAVPRALPDRVLADRGPLVPQRSLPGKDSLVVRSEDLPGNSFGTPEVVDNDVIVKDARKESNSIVIRWESQTSNILGFRVIYRLFGTPEFKQGPPLAPSEREFKIKNVPDNECIAVCVVSLEEVEITPSNVPFAQCREIRTEGMDRAKRLDDVIIPASTAIVVCVIVAVIIFIACLKQSNKKSKLQRIDEKPIHTLSMSMNGLNMAGMPGAPLAGLASLGLGHPQKDWDQMSMYSQRSHRTDRSGHTRTKMYHMDGRQGSMNGGYIPDDARSHVSQFSTRSKSRAGDRGRPEHGLFGHQAGFGGYPNHPMGSRADLRASRQSLAEDIRRPGSRALSRSKSSARQSTRSRSRDRVSSTSGYRSQRDNDSLVEDSDNWATSTDNNWTDYDQDVYTVKNTRRYGRDDVNL